MSTAKPKAPVKKGLKRLSFVQAYAASALAVGEGLYKQARALVPAAAEPYVSAAEAKAAGLAAPLVAQATGVAAGLLETADAKIDAALARVDGALAYSRDLHANNMGAFASAKEAAFGLIAGAVNRAKALLDPAPYAAALAAAADPDKAAAAAAALYDQVAARPPVAKALELADPLITAGQTQYAKAHELVVMQPLYKKFYDVAAGIPALVADAPLVKAGYPLVAPVADPVLANLSKSKVLKQLEGHLKPKAA